MKTKPNIRKVLAVAIIILLSMLPGNISLAQSDADDPSSVEIMQAYVDLEAFCAAYCESLKYVAPTVDDYDVDAVMEKLEMLAQKLDDQIRYRPPDFASLPEYESDTKQILSDLITQKKVKNNHFKSN